MSRDGHGSSTSLSRRRIVAADRVGAGIVITFDDGKSMSFDPDFLYRHGDENGNEVLPIPQNESE
jgi:hypothetical protein